MRTLTLMFVWVFLTGCTGEDYKGTSYSFFVAGHTYGSPILENDTSTSTLGLHTPFQKKFEFIRNSETIKFGVLTGDIVWLGTEREWNSVDEDIAKIGKKVFFAPGNHDVANREFYESRYGQTYFSFTHREDLFIVLDPNLSDWDISGEQLIFLQKILAENLKNENNIFVFFHQLLWWSSDNFFQNIPPNSVQGRKGDINFWTEIEPLFHNIPNSVFMFSGDVGAHNFPPDYKSIAYHKYDNVTLIASGMGGGIDDNFIIVQVDKDKNVSYELIALNHGSEDALGDLEDHIYY